MVRIPAFGTKLPISLAKWRPKSVVAAVRDNHVSLSEEILKQNEQAGKELSKSMREWVNEVAAHSNNIKVPSVRI